MDRYYNDAIDLEGLPSDAFDSEDFDVERHGVSDFSSWPAESSPGPDEDEGMDEEMEHLDPESEPASEDHYEADDPGQNGEDYDGHDEDPETDEESSEDELESVMDGDEGGEAEDFEGDLEFGFDGWGSGEDSEEEMSDNQPSPDALDDHQQIVDLIANYHARHDEDEGLFVDQGPDLLPPLEQILHSVRRNHARVIDLVSELQSEARNLSQGIASRSARENHRHHQYAAQQDPGAEQVRMNEHRDGDRLRDELVDVELRPARASMRRNRFTPLDGQAQPEVIDLTGEPDSPEDARAGVGAGAGAGAGGPSRARAAHGSQIHTQGRNPRRRVSMSQRTPSLSRSDGSILGNQANVIDLTLDDSPAPAPALPPLPQPLPRRNNPENPPHHRHHQHHRRRQPPRAPPIELDHEEGIGARFAGLFRRDFLSFDLIQRLGFGRPHDVEVQVIGGGLNMDNPLGGNIPNLDYRVNGNAGAPKPDHVPPAPAREGFTRDTGNADDVVVCPSCEQELKYDPDACNDDAMRPMKKPRTRKDHEEHHFWALKDCGHVYCKNCYENRSLRKVNGKSSATHFRRDPGNPRKNLCAVDGCPTEANNKSNWVGLFL